MRRLMMLSSVVFLCLVLSVIPARGAGLFSFTTIDFPGGYGTAALGINNAGAVVGGYVERYIGHGFYLYQGRYASIDYPVGGGFVAPTGAWGINDNSQIVGEYTDQTTDIDKDRGFLLDPLGYHSIDFGNGGDTVARGINNLGQIVGYYTTTNEFRGFLLAAGSFSPIDYRDATFAASYTVAAGINNAGQIVGTYQDRTRKYRGFLLARGRYTSIDYPGALETYARGINDVGQIVGYYRGTDNKYHGFLRDAQGRYTSIDYPGAKSTYAHGINSPDPKGRYSIVGGYNGTDGYGHGFVATPCGRLCIPLF